MSNFKTLTRIISVITISLFLFTGMVYPAPDRKNTPSTTLRVPMAFEKRQENNNRIKRSMERLLEAPSRSTGPAPIVTVPNADVVTSLDTFYRRNEKAMDRVLSLDMFANLIDGDHIVLYPGVGGLPVTAIELIKRLKSINPRIIVICTDLPSTAAWAHIISQALTDKFRQRVISLLKLPDRIELSELRLVVNHNNMVIQVLAVFKDREDMDRKYYKTIAVSPDVIYKGNDGKIVGEDIKQTGLFNDIIAFLGKDKIDSLITKKQEKYKDDQIDISIEFDPVAKSIEEAGGYFVATEDPQTIKEVREKGASAIIADNVTMLMNTEEQVKFRETMAKSLKKDGKLVIDNRVSKDDREFYTQIYIYYKFNQEGKLGKPINIIDIDDYGKPIVSQDKKLANMELISPLALLERIIDKEERREPIMTEDLKPLYALLMKNEIPAESMDYYKELLLKQRMSNIAPVRELALQCYTLIEKLSAQHVKEALNPLPVDVNYVEQTPLDKILEKIRVKEARGWPLTIGDLQVLHDLFMEGKIPVGLPEVLRDKYQADLDVLNAQKARIDSKAKKMEKAKELDEMACIELTHRIVIELNLRFTNNQLPIDAKLEDGLRVCNWEEWRGTLPEEEKVDFENGGKGVYFIRIGNLFFLEESQYSRLSGDLKKDLGANVIRIDNLHKTDLGDEAFLSFTMPAILAMMKSGIAGKRVIDAGAGCGILSLVAAKLGALQFVLIEKEDLYVQQASRNLSINGLAENVDYRIIHEDLQYIDKILATIPSTKLETVIVSNIGMWPEIYGEITNANSMKLIAKVPNVTMFIGAGYSLGSGDMEMVKEKREKFINDRKTIEEQYNFRVEPESLTAVFEVSYHGVLFQNVAWIGRAKDGVTPARDLLRQQIILRNAI